MVKLISSKEAVDRLERAGMHTNVNRLQAGIRNGLYPFGIAIKLKEYVYEIYDKKLEEWISERDDGKPAERT